MTDDTTQATRALITKHIAALRFDAKERRDGAAFVQYRDRKGHLDYAAELERLANALEARTEDAARLDWLEEMANKPGGLLLHDGSETGRCGLGLRPGWMVRSLREAIDDARAEPDTEEEDTDNGK